MEGNRVAVIGAGIAGLTAAIFFRRKGFEITVYEKTPAIAPVGAGIGLAGGGWPLVVDPLFALARESDGAGGGADPVGKRERQRGFPAGIPAGAFGDAGHAG